jgi:hypothetical protein
MREAEKYKHEVSEISKDLNIVRKTCALIGKSNRLKKMQQREFSLFGDWLLENKRVTKEEMKKFIHKKEYNKEVKNAFI